MTTSTFPSSKTSNENTITLWNEIRWFKEVITFQATPYIKSLTPKYDSLEDIPLPDLSSKTSSYARHVTEAGLNRGERIIIMTAMATSLEPRLLDPLFILNPVTKRFFAEFGGKSDARHSGFVPTIETAIFLAGGNSWLKRQQVLNYFDPSFNSGILKMIDMG